MANKKITELPVATLPIATGVKFEAVQGGVNVQVDADDMPGGSGTVESVTGDGVDNTDPANPVLTFPAPSDIGLGNVDNTSDANKPVSTAQQTALDLKANIASPTFTGTPAAPTAAAGTNTTQLATTAFVRAEVIGVQDLYYKASAGTPRITSGCSAVTPVEFTTSLVNLYVLSFDQTTQEYAQFDIVPPRKWNNGTITVVPYWTAQSGTGTVRWAINAGMYRNDDPLTTALGTAQNSDDTLIATNDLHVGPATSAITPAGTGADGNLLVIQVSRDPANDTLNADALLLGISIRFTTDAAIDA